MDRFFFLMLLMSTAQQMANVPTTTVINHAKNSVFDSGARAAMTSTKPNRHKR